MAKKHVFPVCAPNFTKLDIATVEEDVHVSVSPTIKYYRGVTSDGFDFFVEENNNEIFRFDFPYISGGEFLLADDLSAPLGSTFDWSRPTKIVNFIDAYAIDSLNLLYPFEGDLSKLALDLGISTLGNIKPLKAGTVVCVGSKQPIDSSFVRNVIPSLYSDDGFGPMGENGGPSFVTNLNTYASVGSFWITVMFTGTRFVILGSNNWV